jgi:hypothetical protein
VDHADSTSPQLDLQRIGQRPLQAGLIDVAMDGIDRRPNRLYLGKRRRGGDVPGMNHTLRGHYQLDAASRQPPRSARQVGVGDHGDHERKRFGQPAPGTGGFIERRVE